MYLVQPIAHNWHYMWSCTNLTMFQSGWYISTHSTISKLVIVIMVIIPGFLTPKIKVTANFSHIIRDDGHEEQVIQGNVDGGRLPNRYVDQIKAWTNLTIDGMANSLGHRSVVQPCCSDIKPSTYKIRQRRQRDSFYPVLL